MLKRMIVGGFAAFAALCWVGGGLARAEAVDSQGVGNPQPTQGRSASGAPKADTQASPRLTPWQCVDLWTDFKSPNSGETIDVCRELLLQKFHNGYAGPQFVNMGAFEIGHGQYQAALSDLTQALSWNDNYTKMEALLDRAIAYDHLGDHAAAKADRETVVQLRPHNAEDYVSIGSAEDILGRPEAALAMYSAAIAKNASIRLTAYEALNRRARVYMELNQYDLAMADFTTAVGRWPGSGDSLNDRCWARATVNRDLDLALSDCNAALDIAAQQGANTANGRESRGFVYLRQGRMADAVLDFDAALSIWPRRGSALYLRGIAKTRLGEAVDGKADITRAEGIDPTLEAYFAHMGVTP